MSFKKPEYPAILANDDWQKKKGVFAKIFAGKTGIGEALEALAKSYKNDVDWDAFDLGLRMGFGGTLEKLDEVFEKAKAETGNLKKVDDKASALVKVAREVEAKFKKHGKIPSSSTAHVGKIIQAANAFSVMTGKTAILKTLNEDYQGCKVAIEKRMQVMRQGMAKLRKYVNDCIAQVDGVKTQSEYVGAFWSETIRGVGTQLANAEKQFPDLKALHDAWTKIASAPFNPKTDEEVPGKCSQVKKAIQLIDAKLKQKGI